MLNLFSEYKRIINSLHVLTYEREGDIFRAVVHLELIDKSILFVKEYVFNNNERKYAYHWVDSEDNLICRWDNAGHWPDIDTFPHHKHIGNEVVDSTEITIDDILHVIYVKLEHLLEPSRK